ncbi:MAG: hypothetical protein MUD12_07405 [Spirochaetes bacterium]|jgi:triacylglycerol lipase|nr:hypothetical protein [Spirochaetota bacterium]
MNFVNNRFSLYVSGLLVSLLFAICLLSGCEIIDGGGNDNNEYPVVLLHGFLGWGRDEMGGRNGYFHMGGYHDMQELIKASGSDCYTAVVGPFSSNWDRTCELYAQLKGLRTDYGIIHSIKHNHKRYGKDWRGNALLEKWGEPGKNKKIHIITHSYGAQTSRTLAQLLATGHTVVEDKDNYENNKTFYDKYNSDPNVDPEKKGPISRLFDGTEKKDMIQSITTVSGTNNGTTLPNNWRRNGIISILEVVVTLFGTIEHELYVNFYDFKVQHFGIFSDRLPDENTMEYTERMKILINGFITKGRDNVAWDISPEGAREVNRWVHAQPNIFYFSYATSVTRGLPLPDPLNNWERNHWPDSNANIIAQYEDAIMMGSYTCNDNRYWLSPSNAKGTYMGMTISERPRIDSKWWENDGTVNTISMKYPWLYPNNYTGPRDNFKEWNMNTEAMKIGAQKGKWNYWGVYSNVDHWDSQGLEILKNIDTNNYNNALFTGPSLNNLPGIDSDNWSNPEAWYVDWTRYLKTLNDK